MNEQGQLRRRQLPHIDVEGKAYFIPACLHGSISAAGLKRIRDRRQQLDEKPRPPNLSAEQWEVKKQKLLFKLVDTLLDGKCPAEYLADSRLAEVIENAFFHFAEQRYRLLAFVVMPSHHHWLFLPREEWVSELIEQHEAGSANRTPREVISHSVQSYTATMCNRILGRRGAFWQTETYDHYVRDEPELLRIVHYIEQNPVVAGHVSEASAWRWSSAYYRKKLGIFNGEPLRR